MARNQIPIVGAIVGPMYDFATRVLFDGRSLHPLQRIGDAGHSGFPSIGAGTPSGFGDAPDAAPPSMAALGYPHILSPAITTPSIPASRV